MNFTNQLDNELNLWDLFDALIKKKRTILFTTLFFTILAIIAVFLITKKYEATVVATYAKDEGRGSGLAAQFGGLAELAGVSIGGGGDKEAAIAFLQSRIFLEQFIEENEIAQSLYSEKWDSEKKEWLTRGSDRPPTLYQAYNDFFKKILSVYSDKKSGLITVTITWKNRDEAVLWANALVKRANERLREKAIKETESSIKYLEKELQKTSLVDVQNTIYRIMESQLKTMMMANTQEQYAFKIIDPAKAVDEDAYIFPKRPLIISLGFAAGFSISVLIIIIAHLTNRRKNNNQ